MELAPLGNNPFSSASFLQNLKRRKWKISAKPDDLYPICYSILKCILVLRFLFCSYCLKIIEKKRAAMKNQSCCIPSNSDPCTVVVYMVDAKLPINAHANFSNAWVRGISNLSNIVARHNTIILWLLSVNQIQDLFPPGQLSFTGLSLLLDLRNIAPLLYFYIHCTVGWTLGQGSQFIFWN